MERQFENRNLKLENCDIPPKKIHFPRKPNLHPTTPSVPSPRVKPVIYRPFGTGTLNRRCSEAWWRAETVIYRPFGTGTPPTRGSVPSSRAKASPNRPQTALTPAFLPVFATATLPTMPSVPSPRAKPVIYRSFGTATLSTRGSVPSPRAKASPNRPQTCLTPAFLPVLGTETLPTSASGASSRGHCELVYLIVALLGFVKFTWHEPSLIIK